MSASSRNWWFGLDSVTRVSRRGVYLTYDGQLMASRAVTTPTIYQAESHLNLRTTGPLPLTARRLDTALPGNRNPRSRQLALQMRSQASDERAFVAATLDYFRSGDSSTRSHAAARYNPSTNAFNTRSDLWAFSLGFVTLMRAAGVPRALDVTGGRMDPVSGYFIVPIRGAPGPKSGARARLARVVHRLRRSERLQRE